MHKSYLEFGYCVEDLLFKGLSVHSVGGLIGLCFGVAVFTFLYEGVKTMRERFATSSHRKRQNGMDGSDSSDTMHTEKDMLVDIEKSAALERMKTHMLQAVLYTLQVTMGYVLMLVIMSYNAWLAITVFTSAGLSYYLFSTMVLYRPSVIPIEILTPEESSH